VNSHRQADQRKGWILPTRFALFLLAGGLAMACFGLGGLRWGQAVLVGFDLAALGFLASLAPFTRDSSAAQVRRHARENDTNRLAVLVITSVVMLVIVTALLIDLPYARAAQGMERKLQLALVLGSLLVAWGFTTAIYTLHYAHLYYRENSTGGLVFPAEAEGSAPDFWDFAYFAATVSMAFATSDIAITSRAIRRTCMVHGAAAFFYNLIVLAFTINVTAGG